MTTIVMGIEYKGCGYNGWQFQCGVKTVQGILEHAISAVVRVLKSPVAEQMQVSCYFASYYFV